MAQFRLLALFAVSIITFGCAASVPDTPTPVPTATPEPTVVPTPRPTSTPTPIPAEDLPQAAESFYKRAVYVSDLYDNCFQKNKIDREINNWAKVNLDDLVRRMKGFDGAPGQKVVDAHPQSWWKRALPELETRLDAIEDICARR